MLPFDMAEHEENKVGEFINKILFRDGTKANYQAIRARCKAEKVSVGSIALAASYMAMAEIHAKTTSSEDFDNYQVWLVAFLLHFDFFAKSDKF